MLDTDEGARRVGEFAIGTNYGIQRFTKNTLFDEKIGGTIHMAVGAGYPKSARPTDQPYIGICFAICAKGAESPWTASCSPKTASIC